MIVPMFRYLILSGIDFTVLYLRFLHSVSFGSEDISNTQDNERLKDANAAGIRTHDLCVTGAMLY